MANTIKLKQGSGSNPSASDLVVGEVALRTDGNPKLFTKNDAGNVLEVGLDSLNDKLPLSGGTLTGNLTISNTAPALFFSDTDSENDFNIQNINGTFVIADIDAAVTRLEINSSGVATFKKNLNALEGLDVTGQITATSHIDIPDNAEIKIGTHDALRLLHDGSNSVIKDANDNPIFIQTDGAIKLTKDGNAETYAVFNPDGAVELYWDNEAKILTKTNGATIQDLTASGAYLDIKGSDGVNGKVYGVSGTTIGFLDNQNHFLLKGVKDGAVSLYFDNSPKLATTTVGVDVAGSITCDDIITAGALLHEGDTNTLVHFDQNDNIALKTGGSTRLRVTNAGATITGTCTATTFSGSGASLTNIPAAQITGTLPAIDGSNLTGLTVENANTLDNLDSSQFLRSDQTDTLNGILVIGGSSVSGNEGGELQLTQAPNGSLSGSTVNIDINGNNFRIFETSGNTRGFFLDLTQAGNQATGKIFHSGNDGAGSGLDSDTLDGLQGSEYVRSNADDTLTGSTYTFSGNVNEKIILAGATNPFIRWQEGTTNKAYIQWSSAGYFQFVNTESGEILRIKSGANGLTFTHDGTESSVFHHGNDGSGSGLDADTVDGIQAASFLRSDADDDATGNYNFSDSNSSDDPIIHVKNTGNATNNYGGALLCENQYGNHSYGMVAEFRIGASGQDRPSISFSSGNSNTQTWGIGFVDNSTDHFRIRHGYGFRAGGWGTTRFSIHTDGTLYAGELTNKIWHQGNDGSGSSLDADLLDGVQASSFLRSDADDTATGVLNFTGGLTTTPAVRVKSAGNNWSEGLAIHPYSDNSYALTFFRTKASLTDSSNTWAIGNLGENSTNNFGLIRQSLTGSSSLRGDSIFDVTQAGIFRFGFNPTVGSNSIWHAGNDGSGSSLDADTVDGIQGANFLRSDTSDSMSGTLTIHSGGNNTYGRINGYANNNHFIAIRGSVASNGSISGAHHTTFVEHADNNDSTGWYFRASSNSYSEVARITRTGGMHINGNKVFHAGNDGAGSGLDADSLDGVAGGSYLRSDTDDTFSGELRVFRNSGITGSSAPSYSNANIELETSSNHVPAISFHRGGYSATTLYEYNGELYINAWVSRNQTGKLLSLNELKATDGSGSGVDSDTLDGLNSSSFMRTDADTETTGYVTINKNITSTNHYSSTHLECRATNGVAIVSLHRNGYSHVGIGHSAANQLFFHMNAGTSYINSNAGTIWGSGNDGSGSGLDADVIDGLGLTGYQNRWGGIPQVYSDGVFECGKYIDFHEADASTADFNFRIYAQGNALHTGGGTVYGFSDINHKKNITKISNPLTKIKEINGYTFNWKSNNNSGGGCIAQEVEAVLPELISTVSDGDLPDGTNNDGKYLNYDGVIGLLVETCKEMLTKITNLETEVNNLKSS